VWVDFLIDDAPPDDDPDAARRAPAVHGSLRLPAAWAEGLLVRAEPPFEDDAPTPLGRWKDLPATVSLQFQIPPLSPEDWDALTPGAVFVVGRSGRRPAFQARACGRAWPLSLVTGGWRVEGPSQIIQGLQENPMSENEAPQGEGGDKEAAAAPADPDAATRKLPVEVAFEVGRMQLPLGKLAELQPGYVFPVPAQLEGANVTIRANGEAVGQGELVSVGDTLGVRLLSWK
ncbi:MAG: type III secretion system cytoplasmic ring protein SctQ, partial [Gammaproteobacteria bacterium]|nr:type III secretion system cytoplasmic ring protein SctQ [Gammaproteobacteria bacterium]